MFSSPPPPPLRAPKLSHPGFYFPMGRKGCYLSYALKRLAFFSFSDRRHNPLPPPPPLLTPTFTEESCWLTGPSCTGR